jgi:beta-glucosidase
VLIDRWRKESERLESVAIRIERGHDYQLRLEYYQNTGDSRVRLVWDVGTQPEWRGAIAEAASVARASEAAIVVAGLEEGEFRDRASLRLPGHQEELIRAVAATGRPVVVVLIGGSAVLVDEWLEDVGAVLLAWYPGEEGGHALADVLFGSVDPAGRLPLSFPMTEGQLPWTYRHKPTGRGDDYADLSGRPRFPFGFGLSYTRFTYTGLELPGEGLRAGDTLRVQLRVRNSGTLAGDEVVQLYLRDEVAQVAQPIMRLAAFQRIALGPGEERHVMLNVAPEQFSVLDTSLRWVAPPGRFQVMVGASAADIRLRGAVTLR